MALIFQWIDYVGLSFTNLGKVSSKEDKTHKKINWKKAIRIFNQIVSGNLIRMFSWLNIGYFRGRQNVLIVLNRKSYSIN